MAATGYSDCLATQTPHITTTSLSVKHFDQVTGSGSVTHLDKTRDKPELTEVSCARQAGYIWLHCVCGCHGPVRSEYPEDSVSQDWFPSLTDLRKHSCNTADPPSEFPYLVILQHGSKWRRAGNRCTATLNSGGGGGGPGEHMHRFIHIMTWKPEMSDLQWQYKSIHRSVCVRMNQCINVYSASSSTFMFTASCHVFLHSFAVFRFESTM